MGQIIIEDIVRMIDDFGVATQRAMPCQKASIITRPVAAVSVRAADMAAETLTLQVTIMSPMDKGAPLCEDMALKVADLMHSNHGADICTVGECQSDERAGVFSVAIIGVFSMTE